ncbi:MAG: error-prone DNA polymerase [Acidobacteriota bacterium]|nr:error-prone DNA polymerase [Acidobacteriota bacterium]
MYVELHAASAFSFLEGASLPEALVERAAALDYPAIALLDRNGLYGAPRLHQAAKKAGLKALVGAELVIGGTTTFRLPVLVSSAEGYRNLCRVLSKAHMRAPKGEAVITLDDLDGQSGGLIALAGREILAAGKHGVGGLLDRLVGTFGRAHTWVELQRHMRRHEESDNQALLDLAAAFRVPLMASNGVKFADPSIRPLHDVFTCIRNHVTIEQAGRRLAVNAERYLKSKAEMARLFADLPQALAGTEALVERLEFTLANLGYRFPQYPVPAGESEISFLRRLTQVGARDRYRPYHDRARAQIDRELALIEKLDLAGYFLIVWDIVNYCRRERILVQGRGSAANSAVCYSLGITAVDPVGMDLLFERFLSEERGEWPDIDLDLPSGDRRERVIQYVYERYGRLGAAMTANVITYRSRSATRELGKVMGFDDATIDRLAKLMNNFEFIDPKETIAQHLADAGLDPAEPTLLRFSELWAGMQDLPRHLGQHSGGMVMCHGRLDEVVPLENASMPDRVVVQWDKEDCADLGLVKVDLLGLGMMAVLEDALAVINTGDGPPRVELAHLPPGDPAVYRMLQEADTIGIFQVESRAQMATLPRLKPENFYDIVVEVAIIRPGPIVGNMVHPYLRRRRGDEPVTYPHPSLEPILKRTLGVPLFQEQLLRIAMVAASFSGGEAEELRRAFGFKRSVARMKAIEEKLRAGMAANGITGQTAEDILKSISAFALYGFPESHAASFALIVYASAWLKAHYPAAFYAAMLNNYPMGFYHPATLVKDAQRHNVLFAPIDVQHSMWDCTVEDDGKLRLGLRYAGGLREESGRRIETGPRLQAPGSRHEPLGTTAARLNIRCCPKCGSDDESMLEEIRPRLWFCNICAHDWSERESPRPVVAEGSGREPGAGRREPTRFATVDELIAKASLRRDEVAVLAEIGALASFGQDRRGALWQVERAVRVAGPLLDQPALAEHEQRSPSPLARMSLAERVSADYAGTGLTIGPHPMALHRGDLALRGVLRASDLSAGRHGRRVRVAGAVITRQRPGTAKGFVFLTLEDETGIANVIVTPDLFAASRATVVGEAYLLVEGVLQIQEGVTAVKADRLLGLAGGSPDIDSHDFH